MDYENTIHHFDSIILLWLWGALDVIYYTICTLVPAAVTLDKTGQSWQAEKLTSDRRENATLLFCW